MTDDGNLPQFDLPMVTLTKAELDDFRARYDALLHNERLWRKALYTAIYTAFVSSTTGEDDDEWLATYVHPRARKWTAQIIRDEGLRTPGQKDCAACNGTGNVEVWHEECSHCQGYGVVERDGGPIYAEWVKP